MRPCFRELLEATVQPLERRPECACRFFIVLRLRVQHAEPDPWHRAVAILQHGIHKETLDCALTACLTSSRRAAEQRVRL